MKTIDITDMTDEELDALLGAPSHHWQWTDTIFDEFATRSQAEARIAGLDAWLRARPSYDAACGFLRHRPLRVRRARYLDGRTAWVVQWKQYVGPLA